MRGEARGHDGSHGGCRWPRRRGMAAPVTTFSRSDRAARLKTGPDRHFLGPDLADRIVQIIYRARTERATSGPKSPLGTSTLSCMYQQ